MEAVSIGIIICSDRAWSGVYEDRGGPAIESWLGSALVTSWRACKSIVPDDKSVISKAIMRAAENDRCALILTTGGTGPALRDVTPEATLAVCDRELPGFGELMRKASLAEVPTAILSRQTAAVYGSSLVVNLPGKPSAIKTCLDAVFPAVPYCIDLIGGARLETDPSFCVSFRPAKG
jgi:molybdopterin adenylyltransferase